MNERAVCVTCNTGHKNDGGGGCGHCNESECCPANTFNCAECSDDGASCVECGRGYALVEGVCGYCEKGYVVVNSSCVRCGTGECCPGNTEEPTRSGCYKCDNEQQHCTTCPMNMKLDVYGRCVPCGEHECCGTGNSGTGIGTDCMNCTDDMRWCGSCFGRYKLMNGRCVTCDDDECCGTGNVGDIGEHCHSCTSDNSSCGSCDVKYKLEYGSCVLCGGGECCPGYLGGSGVMTTHCLRCNDNHTGCQTCEGGYGLLNGVCVDDNGGGDDGGGGNNVGVIVGCVIGGMVVVGACLFVVFFIIIIPRYNRKSDDDGGKQTNHNELNEIGVEVRSEIGNGWNGIVYKGRWRGKDVAVKIMKEKQGEREAEIMKTLNSPYIIELCDVCVIQGRTGLVMEYIAFGSIESLMSKREFSSTLKMRYAKDICLGMCYLHNNKIIHRDLKLSNVLVVSDDENSAGAVCKISDFGTSRDVDITTTLSMTHSMTMTSNIGTPLYMAPELLNGTGRYSMSTDVYSYGIVLAGLWNQTIPYSEVRFDDVGELLSRIGMQGLRPTLRDDCPQPYINLSNACWHQDPHQRPSFDEISHTVFGI